MAKGFKLFGLKPAKDEYYYQHYLAKKNYYLKSERKVFVDGEWKVWPPFEKIFEKPELCPKFEKCLKRLKSKAERLGRSVKKPPCRLHVDYMAKRWLAALLTSHATELMREAEGLSVENFKAHHGYIPPKA